MKKEKICPICHISFLKPEQRTIFCSHKCSGFNFSRNHISKILKKECSFCKIVFSTYSNEQRCCSHACRSKYALTINFKSCKGCNKSFKNKHHNVVYCSSKCYGKTLIGTNKSIIDKLSPEEQRIRLLTSFENRVIKKEGCWGYTGGKTKKYGSIQYQGKSISIHRASWILHYGSIPHDLMICHKCDNPICTNPEHLFLGSARDNVKDMITKGRNNSSKGEKAPGSKLKEEQVISIKKLLAQNISLTNIAQTFNVNIVTIHDIKYEKTWKHVILSDR